MRGTKEITAYEGADRFSLYDLSREDLMMIGGALWMRSGRDRREEELKAILDKLLDEKPRHGHTCNTVLMPGSACNCAPCRGSKL